MDFLSGPSANIVSNDALSSKNSPAAAGPDLDAPASAVLLQNMLACSKANLQELLGRRYRDRSRVLKKIMYLLIEELATFRHPESHTVKELFARLLVTELIKMKYYSWGQWLVGPRRVCCRQTYTIIKIMFGNHEQGGSADNFFTSEDFTNLEGVLHPVGLALLRYYWRHDFKAEIALVEAHRRDDSGSLQLPFKDKHHLATITKKGYVGMLSGNIYAHRFVLALNRCFMENIALVDGQPYRKDSGADVVFEDFQAYTILKRDSELLHVFYTELLELYKQTAPRQREAYKNGQIVTFNTKKLLRKMTKNPATYDLFGKLKQLDELFYLIKIEDKTMNKISLTKALPITACNNSCIKVNAAALIAVMEEIEGPVEHFSGKKSRRGSTHTFYLPVGGRKGGLHAKIIAEHVIALLCQAGRPYGRQPKTISFNLWDIICQYPQIVSSYEDYEITSRKNVWLKRLVEGLYKYLNDCVAPRFVDFTVGPAIKNSGNKTVNIPTSTTIREHVLTVSHNGWA